MQGHFGHARVYIDLLRDIIKKLEFMAVDTKNKLLEKIEKTIKELVDFQKKFQKEQRELQKFQKQTDLQIKQMIAEGEKDRKATKERINELDTLFGDHWGKLMESLVKGDLLKLLQERGINVDDTAKEREKSYKGKKYEFDIIAINGKEIVAVEVKTTLRLQDINRFEAKLKLFKEIFPIYKDLKVYGAVAYLKANEGSSKRAMRKGFFVIRATGSSASIINSKTFKPKTF